jgi:hypothetical protein
VYCCKPPLFGPPSRMSRQRSLLALRKKIQPEWLDGCARQRWLDPPWQRNWFTSAPEAVLPSATSRHFSVARLMTSVGAALAAPASWTAVTKIRMSRKRPRRPGCHMVFLPAAPHFAASRPVCQRAAGQAVSFSTRLAGQQEGNHTRCFVFSCNPCAVLARKHYSMRLEVRDGSSPDR